MSVLANIQQQIADQLAARSLLANIMVLTESVGDIIDAMDKALGDVMNVGGKAGAFIVVMTPDANQNYGDLFGPFFDNIKVVVQVTVNVPVAKDPNIGVGLLGLDICEEVCNALSQFYPAGANGPLTPDVPTVKLVDRGDNQTTHTCSFKTKGGIRVMPPQLPTPTVAVNAGVYTLACGTPGAFIFYTLDGSNPVPINQFNSSPPQTFLYTGPFTPGGGSTLKVRAILPGYLNSNTLTQPIT